MRKMRGSLNHLKKGNKHRLHAMSQRFYVPFFSKIVIIFKMFDRGVFVASKYFGQLYSRSESLKNRCEGNESLEVS